MIAWLSGVPIVTHAGVVVRVGGVGYLVHVPKGLESALAGQSEPIELTVYTHVTEDAIELYGFSTEEEKRLFLLLLSVSGVGPRIALAISDRGASAITSAVQNAEVHFFTSVPRVGKKLAQKIIIDLTSKLGSLKELDLGSLSSKQQDVVAALVGMGFDEGSVQETLRDLHIDPEEPIEVTVKSVLAALTNKK